MAHDASGKSRKFARYCWFSSGWIPAVAKRTCEATQMEIAGAAMLKSARYHSGRRFAIQKEITNPSRATMTVPAAGPNRRTAKKTNVSETDMEMPIDRLTVAEPLSRVSAASIYH